MSAAHVNAEGSARAVRPGALEREHDAPVGQQLESILGDRRPEQIAAELFQTHAGRGRQGDIGVQIEARQTRVPGSGAKHPRRVGLVPHAPDACARARAERLHAAISPSIGPCCYEVDAPVTDAFSSAYPDRWRAWVTPAGDASHVMLDLWTANVSLLAQAGVAPDRIDNPRFCTACHVDTLYSYRKGHKGRLATIAALP